MVQEFHQPKGRQEFSDLLVRGLLKRTISAFRSPRTMGSLPMKRSCSNSRSGKLFKVDGGSYDQMRGIILFLISRNYLAAHHIWPVEAC